MFQSLSTRPSARRPPCRSVTASHHLSFIYASVLTDEVTQQLCSYTPADVRHLGRMSGLWQRLRHHMETPRSVIGQFGPVEGGLSGSTRSGVQTIWGRGRGVCSRGAHSYSFGGCRCCCAWTAADDVSFNLTALCKHDIQCETTFLMVT